MNPKTRTAAALLVVAGLPACLAVWMRMHQSSGFAGIELILYPLLFGSLGIAVILATQRYLLGGSLKDFSSGPGSFATDLLWGLVLAVLCFALFFGFRATLQGVLEFRPNFEMLGLMLDMREHPWMLLAWFGPVLWVGIALFEEVMRVFLLNGLWSFSAHAAWKATAILLAALLFGLIHWSQGPYGIVSLTAKSALIGSFYLWRRRLLPLVIAHVLYDGLQVAMLLLTYPEQ